MSETNLLTQAISKKITRRSFIKWSSAIGATATMSGLVMNTGAKLASAGSSYVPMAAKPEDGGTIVEWRPSCCLVCHGWCFIAVGVDQNGHVRKIEGAGGQPKKYSTGNLIKPHGAATQTKPDDANHIPTGDGFLPFGPHNKGRICAKGNNGMEHLYDPDRIKYPLERVGDRGSGKWRRVSWAYALKKMANILRELAGRTTFYDLSNADTDDTLYEYSQYYREKDFGLSDPRGQDLRHRFVQFIGRNENAFPKNFTKHYGSPNHIEHTSLCEVSRHVAGRTMWGHHWSSYDICVHTDGHIINKPSGTSDDGNGVTLTKPGGTLTLQSAEHDCDLYIEWGGNPAEVKNPHSSCANHMGDRRRRNLQGWASRTGDSDSPTEYGRIICIDVRQSNTAAFADEYFQIKPGTDGLLALGIFKYIVNNYPGGAAALRAELDRGHIGTNGGVPYGDPNYYSGSPEPAKTRKYYGLFTSEESTQEGTNGKQVPSGKSLESVVNSSSVYDLANVATVTGLSQSDIVYLAESIAGMGTRKFRNVIIDGYRGPAKHSNGTHNYRAIRALQIIANNYSAGQYWGNTPARGGFNAPGGFISDGQWEPYGALGLSLNGSYLGGAGTAFNSNLPASQDVSFTDTASNRVEIDKWDYERDLPRWRAAFKWVDQNTMSGIRHSIGLHAYKKGLLADTNIKGPYYYADGISKTGSFDPTFKVEVLLQHKNAITYTRPNQDLEVEALIAKDNGDYRLKHFWSIDIAMGDATRFADLVLPDATYLERWIERSGEGQEFNWRDNIFYRQPVYEVDVSVDFGGSTGSKTVPRHLYDSRQVKAIFYELARYIEPDGAGETPWNGTLYNSFKLCQDSAHGPVDAGSRAANIAAGNAHINDGEYAVRRDIQHQAAGLDMVATGYGAANGFDYVKSHGMMWNASHQPAYWRVRYDAKGEGSVSGSGYSPGCRFKPGADTGLRYMLTVYNPRLDNFPDLVNASGNVQTYHTEADGTFHGTPVYIPVFQHANTPSAYDMYLTTYKINVHTQSRTACLPRLQEIIGNSWVVMHPDDAAAKGIVNGDLVKVTTLQNGVATFQLAAAKVTPKAQKGCVHLSHHQGHREGIYTVVDKNSPAPAFGRYQVNEGSGYKDNRYLSKNLNNPAPSPANDAWRQAAPPSAPGHGFHPNVVITRWLYAGDLVAGDGKGDLSTDPISGSMAWFDTKCKVEKA